MLSSYSFINIQNISLCNRKFISEWKSNMMSNYFKDSITVNIYWSMNVCENYAWPSLIKYPLLECNIFRIIYITRQMDYSESLTGTCYLEALRRHVWWLLWLKWQMLLFISKNNLRHFLFSHWNVLLMEVLNKLSIWLWKLILFFVVCFSFCKHIYFEDKLN